MKILLVIFLAVTIILGLYYLVKSLVFVGFLTVIGTENSSKIKQTAIFEPIGLFGKIYWYSLYPLHQLIFAGMLKAIAKKAIALNKKSGKS